MFYQIFIIFSVLFVVEMIVFYYKLEDVSNYFILFEILLTCKFFTLISIYIKEVNEIYAFKTKELLSQKIRKTENLLNHLMPIHVIKSLKEGQIVAEEIKNLPIMFADIVGFTAFSSQNSPQTVIRILNQLFSNFDALCVQNQCYKVCTIGDCYVAIGYNGQKDKKERNFSQELANMINFGLSLINAIEETNKVCQSQLQMRIGIHIGNVIGGVSGSTIVRYDIYGPAVMIANTMESNGKPGKINISSRTKKALESFKVEEYQFEFNQNITVQLQQQDTIVQLPIDCYFVEKVASKKLLNYHPSK